MDVVIKRDKSTKSVKFVCIDMGKQKIVSLAILVLLIVPFEINSERNDSKEEGSFSSGDEGIETEQVLGSEEDLYPTVNKCCPFHSRYERSGGSGSGKCIRSDVAEGTTGAPMEEGHEGQAGSFWEAPKTIVTLAKDFHSFNMTDVAGDPIVFRLSVGQPNCSGKRFEITHSDLMTASDNVDSVLALSPNGYLLWSEGGYVHQVPSQDFCIDQHQSESTYVAVFCAPVCNELHPCVRKCCRRDAILYNHTCMASTREWEPFLYKKPGEKAETDLKRSLHYKIGVPDCDYYSTSLREERSEKAYLLLNGTLVMDSNGKKSFYEPDRFCVDGSLPSAPIYSDEILDYIDHYQVVHYSGHELDQTIILCASPSDENSGQEPEDWRLMLYACVTLISSFFLLLTALVFIILWEYQNIHGWLQFCYVNSLLFAFTFLAVVQLSSDSIQEVSSVCCKMIGALIHFLFLSAFFWLTSMNFDLWWTFSGCRPMRASSMTGEKKRFFCFSLFSYGLPGLIATTGLVLDSLYRDNPYIITPRFGERYCYFSGDKEKLPYFYGPVGILLTINSVFFISTIYSLHKLQNDTKFATKQSSKQEKKRFLLFMKLFVVMGVLWIFEVISWATMMLNHHDQYIKNIFLPTDLLIGAQGIAIFVIFTCKPNTCRQLEAQLKKFSQFLEEKRDQSAVNTSLLRMGYLVAGFCMIVIPIVNRLRGLMGFCCQITRTLEGRRHMSHTNTLTSTVWDKSRKISDITASVEMELDLAANSRIIHPK